MRPPRLSIAKLMAIVGLVAVGFAALRRPSQLWANAVFSLAAATLTISVLAAVFLRGRERASWVGFASCGWVYLLLCLGPWFDSHVGPYLVTTAVLDILYPRIVPPPPPGTTTRRSARMMGGMPGMMGTPAAARGRLSRGIGMAGMLAGRPFAPGGGVGAEPNPWADWTRPVTQGGFNARVGNIVLGSPGTFRLIGHSLSGLALASLGGLLTRYLDSRRERQEREGMR